MMLRRMLGIVFLSIAVVIPLAADDKSDKAARDKAIAEAKAALKTKEDAAKAADKALADNKDDKKKKDLEKAAADAKKGVEDAKAAVEKAEKAGKDQPAAKAGEKALLKWKFEKGKDFYQKMTTSTEQTMTVQTNKVNQKQDQTFYFKWSFVEQKGDEWTIKQKIEGVVMNIDIGNQKINYDSTKEKDAAGGNNPLSEFFKALKDAEFTIKLDAKTMKVTSIEGQEAFIDKLGKQNPQMQPLLKEILSKDALMKMAEPTFAAIPGKEVTVGEKWDRTTTLNMGPIGSYENKYTYTFEGTEGKDKEKTDKIKVETALKYMPPQEQAGGGTSGLPFKIKSADLKSTKADGTIIFSEALGRIEKSEMNLTLSGKLSIEIGGQTTDVDLTQTQTSKIENSDKPQIEPKK